MIDVLVSDQDCVEIRERTPAVLQRTRDGANADAAIEQQAHIPVLDQERVAGAAAPQALHPDERTAMGIG